MASDSPPFSATDCSPESYPQTGFALPTSAGQQAARGESCGDMHASTREKYEPDCPIAHNLINRLSAIAGHCDLLVEETPKASLLLDRILLIRNMAHSTARELGQLQCDLGIIRRAEDKQKVQKA